MTDRLAEAGWTLQGHERRLRERAEAAEARVRELERELAECADGFTLVESVAAKAQARVAELKAALREIHEYNCGCDQPGRIDLCVAQPVVLFAALSAEDEK